MVTWLVSLLAQGTDGVTAPTTITGALIFGFVGLMALVVWIVKTIIDKTIPAILVNFDGNMKEVCNTNERNVSRVCADFKEQLLNERNTCRDREKEQEVRWQAAHEEYVSYLKQHSFSLDKIHDGQRTIINAFTYRTRMSDLVIGANDGVISVSLSGLINGWNPACERMFGYRPEEALGKQLFVLVPDEFQSTLLQAIEAARRGDQPMPLLVEVVGKDMRRIRVHAQASPVQSLAGPMAGTSLICRIVT